MKRDSQIVCVCTPTRSVCCKYVCRDMCIFLGRMQSLLLIWCCLTIGNMPHGSLMAAGGVLMANTHPLAQACSPSVPTPFWYLNAGVHFLCFLWVVLLCWCRAPLSFFHVTPTGRIINRLTKDTSDVDKNLADFAAFFLRSCLQLTSTIILVGVTTPFALPFLVPILLLFYFLYQYFQVRDAVRPVLVLVFSYFMCLCWHCQSCLLYHLPSSARNDWGTTVAGDSVDVTRLCFNLVCHVMNKIALEPVCINRTHQQLLCISQTLADEMTVCCR